MLIQRILHVHVRVVINIICIGTAYMHTCMSKVESPKHTVMQSTSTERGVEHRPSADYNKYYMYVHYRNININI